MNGRGSIIIVDNNEVLLNMLRTGLSKEGYRCETTTSSQDALEYVAEKHFDVLITDIVMPGLDGFELAEKAKKLRPGMAVIIMTGFIDDFSYDKAMEAGASDFIKKPFTLSEMKMRLHHVTVQGKLHETSIMDEHTGLYNRKGFLILADQQLKSAGRYKKAMVMLCAALDNLKAIDDAFGHLESTQALIDTAHIINTACRDADVIARVGENEFAALPAGFSDDDIRTVMESLRANVAKHNGRGNRRYKLLISSGTVRYDPEDPCSAEELLSRAGKLTLERTMPDRRS